MGEVDLLLGLWGEASFALRNHSYSPLYELNSANVAEISLTEELLAEAKLSNGAARKLLGDLAYRSERLKEELAEASILLVSA